MSCVLRASGTDEAIDTFLQSSRLGIYKSWRQGDNFWPQSKRVHKNAGFSIEVSQAGFDELSLQIEDAVEFLRRNQAELAPLQPLVIEALLDFGIETRDVAVQCDVLPPQLLLLAGTLGLSIELSRYPIVLEAPQ